MAQVKKRKVNVSDASNAAPHNQGVPGMGQATSAPRGRIRGSKAGKLSLFLDMPMDLIYEIASVLHPLDILHLSRASKQFRTIFNPHTNQLVWTAARRNVPRLPDCPNDLNEAQYASLLFENHCRDCNAPKAYKSDYGLRTKLCKRCYNSRTKEGYYIISESAEMMIDYRQQEVFWSLLPRSSYATNCIPCFTCRYDVSQFKAIVGMYLSLEPGSESCQAFVGKHQQLAEYINQSAKELTAWEAFYREDKANKSKEALLRRCADIQNNLVERGWTVAEIDRWQARNQLKSFMDQPRDLTPRIWKQILPKMENILLSCRLEARQNEFTMFWRTVVKELRIAAVERLFIPNASEAKMLPSIDAFLRRDNAGIKVTKDTLQSVLKASVLRNEMDSYKRKTKLILLRAIESGSSRTATDEELLNRENTIFFARHRFLCTEACGSGTSYPGLDQAGYSLESDLLFCHFWGHGSMPSSKDTVDYDHDFAAMAKKVLRAMGLGADATLDDVKSFNGDLFCQCGNPRIKGKSFDFASFMDHLAEEKAAWKLVESHMSRHATQDGPSLKYEYKNDHSLSKVSSLISIRKPKKPKSTPIAAADSESSESLYCVPCKEIGEIQVALKSDEEVEYHLRAKHCLPVEECYTLDEWYYDQDWSSDSDSEYDEDEFLALCQFTLFASCLTMNMR